MDVESKIYLKNDNIWGVVYRIGSICIVVGVIMKLGGNIWNERIIFEVVWFGGV